MSSLESAIRILHCLTADTPRLRVSELAERLRIPKSTVSRLLKALSEGGVLDRDEGTKEYLAGPLTLQLGGLYMAKHDLLDLVDDSVREMVQRFGFTGYVAVLDRAEAVVLRCRQGRYPLKFMLEVGTRWPAAEAALGIGLLAQLDGPELARILEAPQGDDSRPHPPAATTMVQIEEFRRQGWIQVPCLSVPEITAIGSAAAVSLGNQPPISFSIAFPDAAVDEGMRERIAAEVARTARRLSSIASHISGMQLANATGNSERKRP